MNNQNTPQVVKDAIDEANVVLLDIMQNVIIPTSYRVADDLLSILLLLISMIMFFIDIYYSVLFITGFMVRMCNVIYENDQKLWKQYNSPLCALAISAIIISILWTSFKYQ